MMEDQKYEERPPQRPIHPDTLVVGGGIAGIQAALEIANAGFKVYLLERTATIGGHMAMFDKTFPTLDCAACILTPKMVEVGQHPNIELLTFSDIIGLGGEPGDFRVRIRKRARRVNLATCIGCGVCAEKCPAKTSSEFDHGTDERTAIYVPFPQAVPNKYVIDPETCVYTKKGKCKLCVKLCPVEGCIDLDEQDTEVDLRVGSIVVGTGFQPFDASRAQEYGYGIYPNVIHSLQFERLINASGPTGGLLRLKAKDAKGHWRFAADGDEPRSVAIIHCVGSRDHNYNKYCSRVCCMYSLKFAHLVREKLPHAAVYEYYIDMRAFGKGYEEFFERVKGEGIHVVRGRAARVEKVDGQLHIRAEDILRGEVVDQDADMVILSVGLEPRADTGDLARILGIGVDDDGWFAEKVPDFNPISTNRPGIFLAGACQGPKDIPDTVAQASAAAALVLRRIARARSLTNAKTAERVDVEPLAEVGV
jgi:heterodisulfide reductase subunit A